MYDQNPMLWNARIHNSDGRLSHEKHAKDTSNMDFGLRAVISVITVAVIIGAAATGLNA